MVKKEKLELTVSERLLLPNLFPQQSDLVTMRVVTEFKMDVGFTEDEMKDWEMKVEGDRVSWNPEKAQNVEIKIGPSVLSVLEKQVEKLSDDGKITEQMLTLIEKLGL